MLKSEYPDPADIAFLNPAARTGIVYDPVFLKHSRSDHPERAERFVAVLGRLKETGLNEAVRRISSRPASEEELLLNHTGSHVRRVRSASGEGEGFLDPDTYVNSFSYDAARIAAGSLIDLTLAVVRGDLENGFALVRPPGHHAMSDYAKGFCLFNHVALAARAARKAGVDRIAIVDFDAHHGNGTQAAFEDDPRVLFMSTHQHSLFPGTGAAAETGKSGTVVNIPLPAGAGDGCFRALFGEVILPLLVRFAPEMILVSAGYDGHRADPLAGLGLTCSGQAWISETLVRSARQICGGRIVFTLEGGYHPAALSAGVANSLRALLGRDDFEDPIGGAPRSEPDISALIAEVKRMQRL
ncbi:MAG TPA: histone deacetylase [bacterium]|nr:histone deacetylase [bacterium]